ncbi:MAG: monovalent cation/H+ antiporter subunit D [Phenylobacterium sp.]|uniref:monovalent cation/H+ antiporter subunit D n=1 Tax=Phenylobacterium sp. TaxID=1871053 RepID=UPI00272F7D88|nr:monovalent cation/H+ antiporter subunit D [Phenylobacterium sp.]MDP2009013.1 monovalent cation/H+ antiporter subunit D [Phenylobacterium sp.]
MNHWIIAPVVLPAVSGPLIVLALRNHTRQARVLSIAGCCCLVAIAVGLIVLSASGEIGTYTLGNWPAPFGIVLVLDRLAAMMLLLSAILGLVVGVYAAATELDRKGWHFHALLQFQLLGLNGAFLTGDLFNLFVFFEVLLIASYCLMLHGGGSGRLKAGVQYVVVNLVGSTLFLVAVGLLYGVTGTLNMADMGRRIAAAPAADDGLITAGCLLLTTVFALKAAIVPLHFWLPKTYVSTSPAVAALFVIMTKLGAYAIIRCTTLIFGENAGASAWEVGRWLMPAALITGLLGFVGVLSARGLRELAAFCVIGSMGTLLASVSVFQPAAMSGALYYLASSTLAGAALFLLSDMIERRRPDYGDTLSTGPQLQHAAPLSLLFLLTAMAVVGLPPLSGFVGKLLILDGVGLPGFGIWIWSMVLGTTLLAMVAFARAGSVLFWKSASPAASGRAQPGSLARAAWAAPVALLTCLILLSVAAGPATAYLDAASRQLFEPEQYHRAVLATG